MCILHQQICHIESFQRIWTYIRIIYVHNHVPINKKIYHIVTTMNHSHYDYHSDSIN